VRYASYIFKTVGTTWALQRGSRSGRIANQFARDYAGQSLLANRLS